MKPGSRAEFEMDDEHPVPTIGHAEAVESSTGFDGVAAVLWVPDPEQRHGWREVYVRRTAQQRRRLMGFGR